MAIVLGVFTLLHFIFYLILTLKWRAIPSEEQNDIESRKKFSVIIAARNEQKNLAAITEDLENQNYPRDQFEIIIVDDFSEDNTLSFLEEWEKNSKLNITILSLNDESKQGKKYALSFGIETAKNEIILTTDCDCRLPSEWISSFATAFADDTQIVAGGVSLKGDGTFAKLQQVEFSGLVAFGAATLAANNPSICSGANLAFRRKAFEKVGGYESNIHLPSGDDEFLLYDILREYPKSGFFLKSKKSVVQSKTHSGLSKFMNQRLRWASKWKYNKNWKLRGIAILFFFENLSFLAGWIGVLVNVLPILPLLLITIIRVFSQGLLVYQVRKFFDYGRHVLPLILLQIIYPFHILFIGVLSIFDHYTWKGRSY